MRHTFLAFVALSVMIAPSRPPFERHASLVHVEASRMSMACLYAIDAYAMTDQETLRNILESALDEVDRIDRLMSHYKPESPLSRINRDAARHPVAVDPELFEFIKRSLKYSSETDGAFDITVGPLMKAWGFFRGEGHMATEADLANARKRVGSRHVVVDERQQTIGFDVNGVELDLGGIAKGYAVDRVVAILRAHDVDAALVSAGGSTIYALGAPPGRSGWNVSIQDPTDASKVAREVTLINRALSVAGSSEKSFQANGTRYSHIMDPRTGRPVQGMLSVAVLTDDGTDGDALDDALFVLGPTRSAEYLNRHPSVEALFFVPDGSRGWRLIKPYRDGRPAILAGTLLASRRAWT